MNDYFFNISVNRYDKEKEFNVYRPASLNHPKDSAVMFITPSYMSYMEALLQCRDCLVFWPSHIDVPAEIRDRHAVCLCGDPREEYCRFYRDNKIFYLPENQNYSIVNGAFIADGAKIGRNCRIFPGAYLGCEVELGDEVYIGSGVRLIGRVRVGDRVVIRENTVVGSDGLSTNRDEDGHALTMPQFGGVLIEDDVQIGALTVICRGAIDDTTIHRGSKIDNSCFISHNVQLGEDTFIVGETILCGSSTTGDRSYVSGGATVRDGMRIGSGAMVGLGSVVVKDVADNTIVKGNPAR